MLFIQVEEVIIMKLFPRFKKSVEASDTNKGYMIIIKFNHNGIFFLSTFSNFSFFLSAGVSVLIGADKRS